MRHLHCYHLHAFESAKVASGKDKGAKTCGAARINDGKVEKIGKRSLILKIQATD